MRYGTSPSFLNAGSLQSVLPAIVRAKTETSDPAGLAGRSILEAVREEGVSPVYRSLESAFSYLPR